MSDEEENDVDIAAIMGFGTFGSQPQPKRRKMNDATIDSSTGANTTSLGIRQRVVPSQDDTTAQAAEEINDATNDFDQVPATAPTKKDKRAKKQASAGGGLAGYLSRGQAVPDKPPVSVDPSSAVISQTQAPTNSQVDAVLSKDPTDYTPDDLFRLRKGVVNAKGEPVYFQPSFIEDPWAQNASHRGAR